MNLNNLRDEVYEDAVAHGLWEDIDKLCKELADEGDEQQRKDDELYHRRVSATKAVFYESDELLTAAEENNWDATQEELADVVIMAMSAAGYLGIDIDAAVRRKMEINKGRAWKHGKE